MPIAAKVETAASDDPATVAAIAALLAGYRPLPGVYDELLGADGEVRPHWQAFISALAKMGRGELSRSFAAADRHLQTSGVFYRLYDDPTGAERPWPLNHMPLMIDAAEWQGLSEGLIQRASLLESVAADAYGPGQLTRDGILPAAVIAGTPEFLRPLVGVAPPGGAHLWLYAVDLGRGPDGRWWVLNDRTQAPSGAGYALENRMALSRALPELYEELRVERLAGFFQAFRDELARHRRGAESRVCLLTPGRYAETYFEHAYLARYLGFLLVEGEDLTVRGETVYVRTISGLKPADVLWRRLDADFADPLELNPRSRLGIPGLVEAVRNDSVLLANSLGAGFLEANSLMSFVPALAHRLLGCGLDLPNVATWWCGQERERDFVLDRFDTLAIAPAFGPKSADFLPEGAVLGADLDAAARSKLRDAIARRGADFVGQEAVKLSTMPVWRNDRLEPKPFILRLFVARTGSGWTVMPGGFCRVSERTDARAITMQTGGRSTDVWVTSPGPVVPTTLLPVPEKVAPRRQTGLLPSRAADNLFWLARYIERAEATLRVLRAMLGRVAESSTANGRVVVRLSQLLVAWGAVPKPSMRAIPGRIAGLCLHGRDIGGSIPRLSGAARDAASAIRDRFSPDAWRALNELVQLVDDPSLQSSAEVEIFERANQALQIISAFSGLAQENMNRFNGWRFLEIGRRIERSIATSRFIRQLAPGNAKVEALDALLELCDSQITYRLRYTMQAVRALVIDLVALDDNNPRSMAFQLERICEHLDRLPELDSRGMLSPAQRSAMQLSTQLRTADPEKITVDELRAIEVMLMRLSDEVSSRYFTHRDRPEAIWESLL